MLGGLGLELAGGADLRQQGDVHVQHVSPSDVLAHLADRLEERQGLDVTHRSAHLDDHHAVLGQPAGGDRAGPLAGDALDAFLDLVGDVRDDLYRAAQVIAAPLLGDHRGVNAAGRHVRGLRQVLVDEALVVPKVEIRLGAVIGHENLAVLVRRHGSGIDVDVGVELEDRDGYAARLEDPADRGGGDAFAEGAGDATRDEDVLGHRCRTFRFPTQACEQADGPAWFGQHASKDVTSYSGGQSTAPAGPMASPRRVPSSGRRMIVVMTTISDPVQRAFAHGDVIDITTTGRRSGQPRRIEIVYHVIDGRIYISGSPRRERRSWLANLDANPRFTFHLKRGSRADLPAAARIIEDPDERRTVMRHIIETAWHGQDLEAMVAYSPLIEVSFDKAA